jgi:hypothetical protein
MFLFVIFHVIFATMMMKIVFQFAFEIVQFMVQFWGHTCASRSWRNYRKLSIIKLQKFRGKTEENSNMSKHLFMNFSFFIFFNK